MRKTSLPILVAFLVTAGCGGEELSSAGAAPGAARVQQASHSWAGYHWARTSNPFTLKVGNNVDSSWAPILTTSAADWSQSTVLDTAIVAGQAKGRCRGTAGRVEVCNSSYGNNGWLGIASVSVNGTHITQGTVKLNDTYMSTPQYNTTAWHNLVSCQELGHTLGLDHQDTNFNNANLGTCMDYTNDPSTNQHPDQHDYDELVTIYSHVDSTTTLAAGAANSAASLDERKDWGEEVESDGQRSTFVREFGDGSLVVTHVFWAK